MRICPKCREREVARPRAAYCNPCHREYDKSRDYYNKGRHKLWHSRNRDKVRERQLKNKYSITQQDYLEMYRFQEGRCRICEDTYEKLVIDHCHRTGRIRGLLCRECNTGIGLLKESPKVFVNAIEYLKEIQNADV